MRYATPANRRKIYLRRRLKRYGLTIETFKALLDAQAGTCAICMCRITSATKTGPRFFGLPGERNFATSESIAIDHCHATGKVRGLLCMLCNRGLGDFKDDAVRLRAAADYLERSR